MGLSASKRVSRTLSNSSEFISACNSTYEASLALAQHAFPGIRPYQLVPAVERLHHNLFSSDSMPSIIAKWVPSPPDRELVDRALNRRRSKEVEEVVLGKEEFREFSIEVFSNAIVSNAGKELLKKVPIGLAGIAGVGFVVRPGKEVVGTAMGAYALCAAIAVYLNF